MCGILGAISKDSRGQIFHSRHLNTLQHRGPDGEGIWYDDRATFGHRRLAIIDLTDNASQPMQTEDGRYTIIFNGEIYNYLELRDLLAAKGHRFRTQGDTEVLLNAFVHWKYESLEYLRGMFAFAIWDSREQIVFLARDRCGEKPTIFYHDDDIFIFGSEFKAVVPLLPKFPDLDPKVINMYLHYQYAPEPHTLLKGLSKLRPGHFATLSVKSWTFQEKKYWDLQDLEPDPTISFKDLREEVESAVMMTLRSDVPVAVALSGGIDSGLIAALAAKHSSAPVNVFSVGYPGHPAYDERQQAKELADQIGCVFHEVELQTNQFVGLFPEFTNKLDEPIADIAAFGHYSVPKAAADHGFKVLLSGIGGDELFWGYDWSRVAVELNEADLLYRLLSLPVKPLLGSPYILTRINRLSRTRKIPPKLRFFFSKLLAACEVTQSKDQLYFMALSGAPEFRGQLLVGKDWYGPYMDDVSQTDPYLPTQIKVNLPRQKIPVAVQKLLFDTWLVGNSLNLADRVSMSVGVETRLPLLDKELIEKVTKWRLLNPDHHLGQKDVLRRLMSDVLPQNVLARPKSGFVPPVVQWIKEVVNTHGDCLHQGHLIDAGVILKKSIPDLLNFRHPHASFHTIYRLILLETWYSQLHERYCVSR